MALIHTIEKQGNVLFKYRGQIPVVLFIMAVPVILVTDYSRMDAATEFVVLCLSVCLSVIGQLIRAYTIGTTPRGTSGRNTDKQVAEQLNTSGIYSMLRHPLYLGNYLMWIGIVVYTWNGWFVAIVTLAYWLYYERIMFAEERFLERKFGEVYLSWSQTVPAFIPSFKHIRKPDVPFSMKSVFRREYSGALATVLGFVFVHSLRNYSISGNAHPGMTALYVLAGASVIALFLRTLKHYTGVLKEDGRS
ncbi:MAG: DUF1295 domain-containing protein [Flavobacteriales bacterium]|nr:DUF1295 domain-containing protein [Flavobacteriales bacterium]